MQSPDPAVSSETEELILVDGDDNVVGHRSKGDCHDGEGLLHRAFSVFLFDGEGRLMLQQRALGKRLWPGYWSNSCCSHPRRGESMPDAVRRRVREELGLSPELTYLFKFQYHAPFGGVGSERELCSVFIGRAKGAPATNGNEIAAWKFVAVDELTEDLSVRPEDYTPWLKLEWATMRKAHWDPIQGLWQ